MSGSEIRFRADTRIARIRTDAVPCVSATKTYWRGSKTSHLSANRLFQQYSAKPSLRRSTSAGSSVGSQASIELLDCSVISNWTGRPVFFWAIVARCRTLFRKQMSSSRSLTKSQARSLLSIARLKIARSRLDSAISSRTRIDQTCFGSRGFFWPTSNPLFQGS